MKSFKSEKPSRSRPVSKEVREFKNNKLLLTERDKHLDQLFGETLDQDIERCKYSDRKSKKHDVTDIERERGITELAQCVGKSSLCDEGISSTEKECDGTDATVEESLDLSSNEGPSIQSECEPNQIAIVLNGTRYVGNICSAGSSVRCEVEDSEDEPRASAEAGNTSRGETRKEQSRRLLVQHRKIQALIAKPKRSKRRTMQLCTIKEEPCIDVGSQKVRADTVEPLNVASRDDSADDDRRRAIQLSLHRRFKSSCRKRSDASRKQGQSEALSKVASSGSFIGLEWWNYVVRIFAYTIRLYSCSAVRYAMFRSNRSFKPGD